MHLQPNINKYSRIRSSLENYTSNNTTKHETTRVQHKTTRYNTSRTRESTSAKTTFDLDHRCILGTGILGSKALFMS